MNRRILEKLKTTLFFCMVANNIIILHLMVGSNGDFKQNILLEQSGIT